MEKGKRLMPSGLKKKFPGSTNYELEGFVSSVMGLEFGTIPNCDGILPGYTNYRMFVLANSKLPGFANKLPDLENELPVSAKCELPSPMNYELSGSVNYELPGPTNYELFSLVNNESSDLVNNGLSGFVNNELSGLVNFEVDSNLPSSINFAVNNNFSDPMNSGFTSNLPGSEGSEFDSYVNDNQINNSQIIQLRVGGSFNDWDAIQRAVDVYSKQHGFVAIMYHKELDPIDRSIIQCHDYVCWKSGMNKLKKVENICEHHDDVSSKTNCSWLVHFYCGKHTNIINITNIVNEHNHPCDPNTIELAPKLLQFPQGILNKIKDYTTVGQLRIVALKNNLNQDTSTCLKTGAESTQRVESINSVLKKHLDRSTLLKELVKIIEQKLEKEASYNHIRDYYRSNLSSSLPSTYNTIFKTIDLVLEEHLTPISLSL
ncbi:7359_t:CDS:2 [Cetraspora pellucida]|uniref:7359_t:CDS:1 n=1 Tax=Cetraspora pellucida TaxID=1433469 RepID=A0ACA9MS50_9GLOM|nr:7359_t:CDS:2 [Cetraspora pellucida]